MASKKISVDREEYSALCALRDGAHEDMRLRALKLGDQYAEVLEINRRQTYRVSTLETEAQFLRDKCSDQHKLILQMQARLAELEPVKVSVAQPAIGARR